MRGSKFLGINDADYTVQPRVNGKRVMCPFFQKWKSMIERVYSPRIHAIRPSYADCSVCEEWHRFSVFRAWMETQDWEGKALDKDLLIEGNKVYSPETCVFVSTGVNSFLTDCAAKRGDCPLGVHWCKSRNKYMAYCKDFRTGKRINLGSFDCPDEAHMAWKKYKAMLAIELAGMQTDKRVANAILQRYTRFSNTRMGDSNEHCTT